MSKVWVKDVNRWIVGKGDKHWNHPFIPAKDKPQNRMPGQPHHMYRINLSHNILMNLFRDARNPDGDIDSLKLTFRDYYGGTRDHPRNIAWVFDFFISRLEYVPVANNGIDAFEQHKIDYFIDRLTRARDVAPNLPMSELYLSPPQAGSTIEYVLERLHEARESLQWICMPFLRFLDDPSIQRPCDGDLILHINGNINDTSIPVADRQYGFGEWDYLDFLFFKAETEEQAWWYHNAVDFAKEKYFIDPNDVVTHALTHNTILSGNESILGGGNGYKCKVDNNNRKIGCEVGAPQDYCVNNGSQFC